MTDLGDQLNLSKVIIPKNVLGPSETFQNFDPERIVDFKIVEEEIHLYLKEIDRLEAIREFQTTLEAFLYEVNRGVREEVKSFDRFEYDYDCRQLRFVVHRDLFEQDSTALMIERSLVQDALMYQLYSRKRPEVEVKYIDAMTNKVFIKKVFPHQIDSPL